MPNSNMVKMIFILEMSAVVLSSITAFLLKTDHHQLEPWMWTKSFFVAYKVYLLIEMFCLLALVAKRQCLFGYRGKVILFIPFLCDYTLLQDSYYYYEL